MSELIDIVFDGPPSHEAGRFVEVEDSNGASIRIGEWVHRDDGYWVLRISDPPPTDDVRVLSQIAVFNAEIAGMVAENMQRAAVGESMAYVQDDFNRAVDCSGLNAISQDAAWPRAGKAT